MRIRTLLISLLAVSAVSAVASASASAVTSSTCYKTAVAGTGNRDSSCITNVGATANDYIYVMKLTEKKAAGIWCAEVFIAGTGVDNEGKCETVGTPKNFIEVMAPNLEWEVCEKAPASLVGVEPPAKYDEHKCNTQNKPPAEREWEFKKLVGTTKVVSKGGAFTLEVGGKTIKCTAVTDKGTITGGKPGTDLAEEIVFTGCKAGTNGCKAKSAGGAAETIKVTEIKTKLEQAGAVLVDKFEQKTVGTTKEFVTLEFEGATCAGEGFVKTKVKGDVAAECKNLANGNVELNFPKPAIAQTPELEAFSLPATLTGSTEEELANGWAHRCT